MYIYFLKNIVLNSKPDIKPNIVAMGFPAEKLEGVIRNHIQDVIKLVHLMMKIQYPFSTLIS